MYPLHVPNAPTLERSKAGRPSTFDEQAAMDIEDKILKTGASLQIAAELCGVAYTTAHEWQKNGVEFRRAIARAKAQWLQARLEQMQETDPMTGLLAHPAQVSWLISKHFRSQYGDKIEHEHTGGMTLTLVTPEQLAQLQERKRALSLPEKTEE